MDLQINITTILAVWGAMLSTVLFAFKVWELWRDRFRLSASLFINSGADGRNVIAITNGFKNPITIDGFDLFWAKKLKKEDSHQYLETELDQECQLLINPYATRTLTFEGQFGFRLRQDSGRLYVRLHIAGHKKRITLQLYKP